MTSLIRSPVPISTPLASDTIGTVGGIESRNTRRFSRNAWLGTPSTTASTPSSASSKSEVAPTDSGQPDPGQVVDVEWVSRTATATDSRRAHSVTERPASASTLA